jgi:hypothetical protein
MTEPDVTLTDYGLAILCAVLGHIIFHRGDRDSPYRLWLTAFFLAVGGASLLGGTVHGFFSEEGGFGQMALWRAALITIGIAAYCAWVVGVRLLLHERIRRVVMTLAAIQLLAYAAVVLVVSQDFRLAVGDYLPATIFLLIAFVVAYRRDRVRALGVGSVGLVLTFVAAAIQQLQIPLHPTYFDHNALYHVVQALALLMLFVGARHLAAGTSSPWRGSAPT